MFALKSITASGVAGALRKAERYRLLNDPEAAESICLDVLEVEPRNEQALELLLLARTDQLGGEPGATAQRAREVLALLGDAYLRVYYAGLIAERRAKALLRSSTPGAAAMVYDALREAMECYERAEPLRPAGNDDALLRYNACVRILRANPGVVPRGGTTSFEPALED